ncbi:MAG: ornithine cyclodeaminase family protein [Steroidobacteraceae bacterium]
MISLDASQITELLTPADAVAAVEAALRAHAADKCVVPQRHHIEWQGNTFLAMPAVGGTVAGVKLVSVVPENARRNLPVTIGVMMLTSAQTGEPLALLNAAALTAIRTGAVGALGLRFTTPAAADSIGIIGCGGQGTWQAISACAVRPIRRVFALRRSAASFDSFCQVLKRHVPAVEIVPCRTPSELLEQTDIVIAATTSLEPVLPDDPALVAGKHFVSVGSYRRTMQELPDAVYRAAGALVIDTDGARTEVGDIVNALARNILTETDIFPLVELVLGRRSVDVNRTTAYKTAGSALFDLYAAQAVYELAQRRGIGNVIEL